MDSTQSDSSSLIISSWSTISCSVVLIWLVYKMTKSEWWDIHRQTVGRDWIGIKTLVRVKWFLYKNRRDNATVAKLFKRSVNKHPDKVLFYYENQQWTFRDVDKFSNKIANYFSHTMGLEPGSEVSLFMEPCPEYVSTWLGLSKAGIIPALVNTGLRSSVLASSIAVLPNSRVLIYGPELKQAVEEASEEIRNKVPNIKYVCYGDHQWVNCDSQKVDGDTQPLNLESGLKTVSDDDPKFSGNFSDKLLYIYTSGTTGLPKAAIIRQSRYIMLSSSNDVPALRGQDQVIYCPMPLYHSLGGGLAVSLSLIHGHSLAIRRKFSPSAFWQDCIFYKCTMFVYVGEVCRYLLSQPPGELDQAHQVRIMMGVGFRPSIWRQFVNRFNIKHVVESYGSTEGNLQLLNLTGHEGACGFIPQTAPLQIFRKVFPVHLIKVDPESGEPNRGSNGLCIECKTGEVGQFVVRIIETDPTRSFDGYVDKTATEKKVVRDVMTIGDACFATGDLVMIDKYGYVFFRDRIGDTYRWKSENVSTSEVESVLIKCLGLADVVVYGVEVPGTEGKAGMATIAIPKDDVNDKSVQQGAQNNNDTMSQSSVDDRLDISRLYERIGGQLPAFAMPMFVRITTNVDLTGTFKFNKVQLKKDAFNPISTTDAIYYLDLKSKQYNRLTGSLYEDILNGQIRF